MTAAAWLQVPLIVVPPFVALTVPASASPERENVKVYPENWLALSSVFCVSVPTAHVPVVITEATVLGWVTGPVVLLALLLPPQAARSNRADSTTKGAVPTAFRMR